MFSTQRILSGALLAALASSMPACVERRITIGSDPAGAIVLLNDLEVGRTPVSVPFTWYGDYDVRLSCQKNVGTVEKPVMQRYFMHTHRRTKAPPFQWLGVDLFAELWPAHFKDEQVWAFTIPAVVEPSDDELLERAQELKSRLGEPEALQKPPPATAPKK